MSAKETWKPLGTRAWRKHYPNGRSLTLYQQADIPRVFIYEIVRVADGDVSVLKRDSFSRKSVDDAKRTAEKRYEEHTCNPEF